MRFSLAEIPWRTQSRASFADPGGPRSSAPQVTETVERTRVALRDKADAVQNDNKVSCRPFER